MRRSYVELRRSVLVSVRKAAGVDARAVRINKKEVMVMAAKKKAKKIKKAVKKAVKKVVKKKARK
jgi:hypothetical protein